MVAAKRHFGMRVERLLMPDQIKSGDTTSRFLRPWRTQAVPTGIGLAANGLDDGGSNLLRSCLASKVDSVWTLQGHQVDCLPGIPGGFPLP